MVQEFLDIFPKNLLGLASEREVTFNIELALETTLISKTPYRIASVAL